MRRDITFKPLSDFPLSDYISLHGDTRVVQHLPLAVGDFNEEVCRSWIKVKQDYWETHGFGPQAVIVNDRFAGWAGLQPELGQAALAIVLKAEYWGAGWYLAKELLQQAFNDHNLPAVSALLPPSRVRLRALARLGFRFIGEVDYDNCTFLHYQLQAECFSRNTCQRKQTTINKND